MHLSDEPPLSFSDKPKPPEDLKVSEMFADNCKLSWTPPADDGGGEITEYIVEKQQEGSGFWEKVPNLGSGPSCHVSTTNACHVITVSTRTSPGLTHT